ncbi:MAG: DUF4855 domain-containing protein [Bacteroidales bacterium]|nr:DUF4855 domain-containing protein [Bacteroidales bacterium]
MRRFFPLLLILGCLCLSCKHGSDAPRKGNPVLRMGVDSVGGSIVVLNLELLNAEYAFCKAVPASEAAPSAEALGKSGIRLEAGRQRLEGLSPETDYVAYACAAADEVLGSVQSVSFRTMVSEASLYDWERSRNGIPDFADLVLLYGLWRRDASGKVLAWSEERIAPLVSWTDGEGREHWLFDAFLALEGCNADGSRSFMIGTHENGSSQARRACTKADAQAFIDWWMRSGNGFSALDKAVGDAATRMGAPAVRRYAIMMMPDIPVNERYDDRSSSTTYWGEVDGVKLDFGRTADRLRAYQWYVDEVRRRFDEAGFSNLELGGFYPMTEELPTTRAGLPGQGEVGMDGWEQQYKRWDDIFPALSDYIHQYKQSVVWIPYRNAAGYRYTSELGLDYVFMQPNRLWNSDARYNMADFFETISAFGLGMELEFDDNILSGRANSDTYQARWREYVDGMRENGVYGSRRFALYQDTDSFNHFRLSGNARDREIYDELCELVSGNPLKAK